jgi:hypothetical protein
MSGQVRHPSTSCAGHGPRPAQLVAGVRPSAPASTPYTRWPSRDRRLQLVHAFLFAATDAELDTAAQAHEAQARQLRDPAIRRPCAQPGR